jgi:hypothetical protein
MIDEGLKEEGEEVIGGRQEGKVEVELMRVGDEEAPAHASMEYKDELGKEVETLLLIFCINFKSILTEVSFDSEEQKITSNGEKKVGNNFSGVTK